jgi:hypothetical protein
MNSTKLLTNNPPIRAVAVDDGMYNEGHIDHYGGGSQ